MDSDSSSCHSSSYEGEYWLLKKRYDEVLESNSQMVLRLEEAKSTLFKSTKQLQSQNSFLMSENMNLRAQKENFQQELEKFRTLVEHLAAEIETQTGSVARQKDYLAEIMCQVDSVVENKNNDLTNPDTASSAQRRSDSFLNKTALQELDKQLRASNIASYYLPSIEEENWENHDDDHDGHDPDGDDDFNVTRTIRPPATIERNPSQPTGHIISKIRKHCASAKSKRNAADNETRSSGHHLSTSEVLLPQRTENVPPEKADHEFGKAADHKTNTITKTQTEINEQTYERMVATAESSSSTTMEHGKHDDAEVMKEKINHCREDDTSMNQVSESNSCGLKDVSHRKQKKQPAQQANEEILPVEETLNPIILKRVASSYRVGSTEQKCMQITSTGSGSIQNYNTLQDMCTEDKIEKLVCRVELVDVFGPAQSNGQGKQACSIFLPEDVSQTSPTKGSDVASDPEGSASRSRPIHNMLTRETNHCKTEGALVKESLDSRNTQSREAHEIREIQPPCRNATGIPYISGVGGPKEPSIESTETSAENLCSGNKKIKPRKTRLVHTDTDANAFKDTTQEALLPLMRNSKPAKTTVDFVRPSNHFSPFCSNSKSATDEAFVAESGVSVDMGIPQDENDNGTGNVSTKHETLRQSKPSSVFPSTRELEDSTGRILRPSRMGNAGSVQDDGRVSVASSQGDSCCSDWTTPKPKRRVRGGLRKELVTLLGESAAFRGDTGVAMLQERGVLTRARSKPRRNPNEAGNVPRT